MGKSIGKWVVQLTETQREQLQKQARAQSKSALAAKRARILLLCDQSHSDGGKTDDEIAEQIGMTRRQVQRIRTKFAQQGLETTLKREVRSDSGTARVLDGRAEARLVALCCGTPPEGRQQWTMQLLADELCRLKVVTHVCSETVRRTLKKSPQALADAAVLYSRTGSGSIRLSDGRGSGRLPRTSGRCPSIDLYGRSLKADRC